MANPSLQIGNGKFAIKENDLLGYSSSGTRFFPIPITMTRATLGSRVNPSGLIEDVALLGDELVTNGDFATDSDWTKQTGWSISGGSANYDFTTNSKYLRQTLLSGGFVSGKSYRINFEITDGTAYMNIKSNAETLVSTNLYSTGSYSLYVTASANGSDLLIYGRNTSGTAFSIDNVSVKEATLDGLARVDYTDGTGSLLVEPQRTNLLTYSEDFSSGIWGNYNSTTTSSETTAPDGFLSGSKFSGTADVTAHTLFLNAYTVVASNDYTYSVFAKKNESNFIQINTGSGFSNLYANFDLDNGVVGNFNTLDANIESYSNGWFKCSVKANSSTTTGQTTFSIIESLTDARNPSFNALNKSVYIWGAQLEEGAYPTSYIKTQGSSVTRNKDQYTKTGISDKINSEEGVLFVEMAALSDDGTDRRITLTDGTVGNAVNIGLSQFSGNINSEVYSGGVLQTFNWGATGVTQTNNNKFALSWGSGTMKFYVNGSPTNTETGVTSPIGLNSLKFSLGNDTLNMFAKVKQLQVFKTALSDSELATLTS